VHVGQAVLDPKHLAKKRLGLVKLAPPIVLAS
jgi:hypothetical protein